MVRGEAMAAERNGTLLSWAVLIGGSLLIGIAAYTWVF
jgi:hypothetical protein